MPVYTIKAPDGNTYSIDGPDGASKEDVVQAIAVVVLQERLMDLITATQGAGLVDPAPDGVVRRDFAIRPVAMTRWPAVAEEQQQLMSRIDRKRRFNRQPDNNSRNRP